jgi:ABC-type spermidine/putrescine transport system permease subunit II
VKARPFLRSFVTPAALCALGFLAAMAAVLQYSVRAFVPGSLEPGGFTLANFADLLKPLYARVFVDTVWICFLTAVITLLVGYPLAYALVHVRNRFAKSFILITVITPLFLGDSHVAAVDTGNRRRGDHSLCLDLQRIRHPAAYRRRASQYDLEPRLSARLCEL